MKNTLYVSALLALFLTACSDITLNEIDTNPNVISDAPLNTTLPAAQMTVFQRVVGSISIVSGYASEQTNFTGINTSTKFQLANAASNHWGQMDSVVSKTAAT